MNWKILCCQKPAQNLFPRRQPVTRKKKKSPSVYSNESSWSNDILWALTIPAIWSDQAKQFMWEAAIQVRKIS